MVGRFSISVDGTRIAYDITGSGPALMLLHGAGKTRWDWHKLGYVEQPQSDTFIGVLRLVFALVPTVLLLVALFFARRFPLTPEVHERLCRVLAVRRSGGPESDEIRQEAKALEKLLIGG